MDNGILVAGVGAGGMILGGGGVWAWLTRREDRAAQREENEIGRLRDDVDELRERDERCQANLHKLETRLWAMEQAQDSHLCRWLKDGRQRVTWINSKALLCIFAPLGLSREDVEGKTFAELLDPLAAAEINRLDQAALAHPGSAVSNLVTLHPMLPLMVVVKVAAADRAGNLVYEGYAYRTNDRDVSESQGAGRQRKAVEASVEHLVDRRED